MIRRYSFARLLASTAFIVLVSMAFAGMADAVTLTVNASGGADFTSIGTAINTAATGDTILVYSGTYYENINVNKPLILTGIDSGGGKPVINGSKGLSTVILSANGITFEGFIISNGSTGINATSSNNFIRDNIVQNNIGITGSGGYGIRLNSGSINNTLANNIVQNNYGGDNTVSYSFAGSGYGIYLGSSSSSNNFTGNIIRNNNGGADTAYYSQGGNGYGIYLGSSSSNTFTNNTVENHMGGLGAYGNRGGSGYGIYMDSSNSNIFTNNTVQNNRGTDVGFGGRGTEGYGVYLSSSSSNTFANNTIQSNNGGNGGSYGGGNGFGIFLDRSSNSNNFTNNAIKGNSGNSGMDNSKAGSGYGIYLSSSSGNTFTNNIAQSSNGGSDYYYRGRGGDGYGIYLINFTNSTFTDNTIRDNNGGGGSSGNGIGVGISLSSSSNGNFIYNNFFKNSNNFYISASASTWNTSIRFRTNIIGGPYVSGNFWANPGGTGFSQICIDAGGDGICDSPYILDVNNADFLPLSINLIDTVPPASIANLHNISYAPDYITWIWSDPSDLDFSYVKVYLNGVLQANISKGAQSYNATGLLFGTAYTISTRTVDGSGNVNQTWLNNTATTINMPAQENLLNGSLPSINPSGSTAIPAGYGKYQSEAIDAGKAVTFTSIELAGTGISGIRIYTTGSVDGILWSNWTQAIGSPAGIYSVPPGLYGRYFGYIIAAPAGTVISGVIISYVESPEGVIYIT